MSKDNTKENPLSQQQMRVEASKFGPFLPQEHISRPIRLPAGYGKDRIVAMVRDPWWIFAYWEITQARERAVREEIAKSGQTAEGSILRVYDITGVKGDDVAKANRYFDITLKDWAGNWYINAGVPNRTWRVDIGITTNKNSFFVLARSNTVKTPRFGVSDILDAEWMCLEELYWTLFGASADIGKGSLEMRKLFERYIEEWVSSGAISSFWSQGIIGPR